MVRDYKDLHFIILSRLLKSFGQNNENQSLWQIRVLFCHNFTGHLYEYGKLIKFPGLWQHIRIKLPGVFFQERSLYCSTIRLITSLFERKEKVT